MGKELRGHRFDVVLVLPRWVGGEVAAAFNQSIKATYWLDDSKRAIGMMDMGAEGASIAMDMSMSQFGEPVSIPKVP